mmetsp:Transcript_21217/g.48722  ORF Transcript_21217/g.48722 Transcript_21217/m.48722 type:complete len:644 (+) Transcript_21217:56-1987(+)
MAPMCRTARDRIFLWLGLHTLASASVIWQPRLDVSLDTTYVPEQQSEYQLSLFEQVSETAANKSKAALPELLAELDEPAFRKELHECCPSMVNSSAEELHERLKRLMSTAEILSGFYADQEDTMKRVLLSGGGMSIDEGLNSTFFQNYWHRTLLHPGLLQVMEIRFGHVNMSVREGGEVALELWHEFASAECDGKPTSRVFVVPGTCHYNPGNETTLGAFRRANGGMDFRLWRDGWKLQEAYSSEMRSTVIGGFDLGNWSGLEEVPCPKDSDAFIVIHVPADQRCNSINIGVSDYLKPAMSEFVDKAELMQYHLKPFKNQSEAADLDEAMERGFYAMMNLHHVDTGSTLFGDVSAVFSTKFMRKSALVSAVDTGFANSKCLNPLASDPNMELDRNCSYHEPFTGLGTLEHFDHLFLANHRFWKPLPTQSPLTRLFKRMEGRWGDNHINTFDLVSYFEVVPAGAATFPGSVRFLIAGFRSLFGTRNGAKVRQWAANNGWILVWALGLNVNEEVWWGSMADTQRYWPVDAPMNQRIIDPFVALTTTAKRGLPLDTECLENFEGHWNEVLRKRIMQNHATKLHNVSALFQWRRLRAAIPMGLHVHPVDTDLASQGSACPEPGPEVPECVGVNALGKCICYEEQLTV